jgi:hypothetical protein
VARIGFVDSKLANLIFEWIATGAQSLDEQMKQTLVDMLLVNESPRGWFHLTTVLERMGCRCWIASERDDIVRLMDRRSFRLILSMRPITQHSHLMSLLKGTGRSIFDSVPVEGHAYGSGSIQK